MAATSINDEGKISQSMRNTLCMLPGFDPFVEEEGYWFDEKEAKDRIYFIEHFIKHVKGKLAGQYLRLGRWQRSIVANLFGWKNKDGFRRFRNIWIYVPRKNGKTTLVAAIILCVFFMDKENGMECYSLAGGQDQAHYVFDVVKSMILQESSLESKVSIYRTGIVRKGVFADSYRDVSAKAQTKHGFNTHLGAIDEVHVVSAELVDVITTSVGSRDEPILLYTTTADYARESICNEKYDHACKVRDGVIEDPQTLPAIFEATVEDDWTSAEIWKMANPNYDVSVSAEFLEAECAKAKSNPRFENVFKRLYLNIITQQQFKWLPMDKWPLGSFNEDFRTQDELVGQKCWAGLDLASVRDVAALSLVFPSPDGKNFETLHWFWCPKEGAYERELKEGVSYFTWSKQGFIKLTEGNVIDFDVIFADVVELSEMYNIREIACDRWNAQQLMTQMAKVGIEPIAFGQGYASLSEPSKKLEALFLSGSLCHYDNPVLKWMFSNVLIEQSQGAIKPVKDSEINKIDGVLTTVMALGRILAEGNIEEEKKGSVYGRRQGVVIG